MIEDVAQALGGTYDGKKLGSIGDVSIFSFQHNKIITTGDGGVLATDNQEIYERAVRYHDLGALRPLFQKNLEKPVITEAFPGYQWRMNELTGAVALAQLRKVPAIVKAVKSRSNKLRSILIRDFPDIKFRDVKTENDMGIVIEIILGSEDKVKRFREAYEAEGLIFGATSGCGTLSKFEPVSVSLKIKKAFRDKDFEKSKQVEGKMAGIAVLPVYTEKDIKDIATGAIKVLSGLDLLKRRKK